MPYIANIQYPAGIDNNQSLPPAVDLSTPIQAAVTNALRSAIIRIENELGIKPSGSYGTVRNRLDTLSFLSNAGGDLSGTYPNPTVVGIQNNPIATTTPTIGQALIWTGSIWSPGNVSSGFTAGGDLSGTSTVQRVIAIDGYALPNPGNHQGLLQSASNGILSWSALNLASSAYITGILPVANQASQTMGGDLSGTTAASTIIKIDGYALPNPGQNQGVLQSASNGTLSWAAVNLNSSTYVTGVLPTANQSPQTMNGDVSGTTNSSTVIKLQNVSVSNTTPTDGYLLEYLASGNSWTPVKPLTFIAAALLPTITQVATSSGSGQALTIQAQSATGASNNGGDLILSSGASGSSLTGNINLQSGGTTQVSIKPSIIQVPKFGGTLTGNIIVDGALGTAIGGINAVGAATVTNGSPAISGSAGASFGNLTPGQIIQFSLQTGTDYVINSVIDSTHFTLTTNYTGTGGTSNIITFPNQIFGSGTSFTTQAIIGNALIFSTQPGVPYIVQSIQSDTRLTLTSNYSSNASSTASATIIPVLQQSSQTTDTLTNSLVINGQNAFTSAVTNVTGGNIGLIPGLPANSSSKGGSVVVYLSPPNGFASPIIGDGGGHNASFAVASTTNYVLGSSLTAFSVVPYNSGCRTFIAGTYLDDFEGGFFTINALGNIALAVNNTTLMDIRGKNTSSSIFDFQNIMVETSIQFQSTISNPAITVNTLTGDAVPNNLIIHSGGALNSTSYNPGGTVYISNGSPTLNGVGTFFPGLFAGQTITISGVNYVILTVVSNTQLTLTTNYTGTTINSPGVAFTVNTFNVNGAPLLLQGGASTVNGSNGVRGGVKLQLGAQSSNTMVEIAEPILGQRSIALAQLGTGITSTQMPTNTGDGVIWIGNAQTNPTAAPAGGAILYSSGGVLNVYQSNGTAFAITPSGTSVTMTGDVTGASSSNTVTKIQGNAVKAVTLGASQDGYVATWVNGSADIEFKPAATTTTTVTMTGDVTGASNSNTVAKVNGATVPASGSLTTGNVLQVSGAAALTYSAINLGGGANFVTGTLPAGNQSAQTMGGDASGTTGSTVLNQATGGVSSVFTVTNPIGLSTGTVAGTGDLRARNATTIIGARNAANTADISVLSTDASNNISVGAGLNDGYVILNTSTGNLVKFQVNSVDSVTVSNNTISLPQLTTAYTISQPTQTSDVATNDINITPQGAFASASTNTTGGAVALHMAPPTNGGTTEAKLKIYRVGTSSFPVGLIGPAEEAPTFGIAISGGVTSASANQNNIVVFSNNTILNGPSSGGAVTFRVNGGQIAQMTTAGLGGTSGAPIILKQSTVTIAASGTTTLSSAQQGTMLLTSSTVSLTGAITIDFNGIIANTIYYLDLSGISNISTTAGSGNTVSVKNGTTTKEITNIIKGKTETAGSGCVMVIMINGSNNISIG